MAADPRFRILGNKMRGRGGENGGRVGWVTAEGRGDGEEGGTPKEMGLRALVCPLSVHFSNLQN